MKVPFEDEMADLDLHLFSGDGDRREPGCGRLGDKVGKDILLERLTRGPLQERHGVSEVPEIGIISSILGDSGSRSLSPTRSLDQEGTSKAFDNHPIESSLDGMF